MSFSQFTLFIKFSPSFSASQFLRCCLLWKFHSIFYLSGYHFEGKFVPKLQSMSQLTKINWPNISLAFKSNIFHQISNEQKVHIITDIKHVSSLFSTFFIHELIQCIMGHLMCAGCFTHLLADSRLRDQVATCPNCRCEISKSNASRNLAVEKAVSELPSECQVILFIFYFIYKLFFRCFVRPSKVFVCPRPPDLLTGEGFQSELVQKTFIVIWRIKWKLFMRKMRRKHIAVYLLLV